jgi:hypothetical protein
MLQQAYVLTGQKASAKRRIRDDCNTKLARSIQHGDLGVFNVEYER